MQTEKVTPMMAQYLELKADHQDALLFYRMGDFYEMFFDDAIAAAEALDIALTKRGKHQGKDIAMCGVPVHAAEGYLLTLIRKGFRVAVCEQMESPAEAKKRGYKSVVKRDVVRLVTPGTLTEDALLDDVEMPCVVLSHEFMGMPATGKHVTVQFIEIDRIRDGKFVDHWEQVDMMGMMGSSWGWPQGARPCLLLA